MKLTKQTFFLLLVCAFLVSACSESNEANNKITVATASNMQFAMEEIASKFESKTGIICELVISSSGKLTAQIKEGAPYDVFVSANMKYPEEIHKSGLSQSAPKVYAHGKLVLWTTVDKIEPSIDILNSDKVEHIAIANPKTAPYGLAAMEVLDFHNIKNQVINKLVYGESISQTNQFISSKAANIGFTSMSVVLSPEVKGKGKWVELSSAEYTPIKQGVVVIERDNIVGQPALDFYEYLFSEESKEILTNFGYTINE